MFDVGFAELLLLSLVGLLVLGPERLPRVARTLGGMARKARTSWLSLKRTIEAEMRAEELKEPLRHFEKELKSTVDEVKSSVSGSNDTKPAKTPAASAGDVSDDADQP
jgi:sec-independent protein translocase protein TatB